MQLNLSGDFALFDNVESVTLQEVTPDGVITSHTGVQAIRRDTENRVMDVGGQQINPDMATWHLDASTCPVTPARRFRIVAAAGTWVILKAAPRAAGTRFTCETQKVP